MGSRKKKKKRGQNRRPRPLKPGLPMQGLRDGSVMIRTPVGEKRMSEVLLEFVEPYSDHWKTAEDLKKVLGVAVLAWNAALYPGPEREKLLREMVAMVPPDAGADFRSFVEEMIQRKVSRFAANKRVIINYD